MRTCAASILILFFCAAGLAPKINAQERNMALTLSSTAFSDGREIPVRHTCKGADVSPQLAWSGIPANAKSLALIVDDPDAPDPAAPRMTWVHWVVYNIPPTAPGLQEGGAADALPAGALQGTNDFQRATYGGPCPPVGRHRYFFRLYALDTVLPDLHHPTKAALEHAMTGHVVARTELLGTFEH